MDADKEFWWIVKCWERGKECCTVNELLSHLSDYVGRHPEQLDDLTRHSNQYVREAALDVLDWKRRDAAQVKDIARISRTSPLQPGVRLRLYGGYTETYMAPWWLNGRDHYGATFVRFADTGPGKMPAAVVELDDEVDMTEQIRRHKGRYALLWLQSALKDWTDSERVTVHIVESPPQDCAAFYKAHPLGTEIETHATYRIVKDGE